MSPYRNTLWAPREQRRIRSRVPNARAPVAQHVRAIAEWALDGLVLRQREREELRLRDGDAQPLPHDVPEELGALPGLHRLVGRRPALQPPEAAPEARLPLGPQVEPKVRGARLVHGRADDVEGDLIGLRAMVGARVTVGPKGLGKPHQP